LLAQQTKGEDLAQTYRTGDQALVREINLSTVLRYLHEGRRCRAPAGLAHRSEQNHHLQPGRRALDRGLVREIGLDVPRCRPATLLELNSQAGCIVGVELGVDFVSSSSAPGRPDPAPPF